jgi:hypothetical protein
MQRFFFINIYISLFYFENFNGMMFAINHWLTGQSWFSSLEMEQVDLFENPDK